MSNFIDLQPSYFTEESEFQEEIYPKFRVEVNRAAVHFKHSYAKLIEKYYDFHFQWLKNEFFYHWRRVTQNFLSQNVFSNTISPESLYTNLINFIEFSEENWKTKDTNNYFELTEFVQKFTQLYHSNIDSFNLNR